MQVVKDNSLTINDQEFFQLDQIIGEMPTKYGIKLVQFFNMVRQKRMAEEQMLEQKSFPHSPGPNNSEQPDGVHRY